MTVTTDVLVVVALRVTGTIIVEVEKTTAVLVVVVVGVVVLRTVLVTRAVLVLVVVDVCVRVVVTVAVTGTTVVEAIVMVPLVEEDAPESEEEVEVEEAGVVTVLFTLEDDTVEVTALDCVTSDAARRA